MTQADTEILSKLPRWARAVLDFASECEKIAEQEKSN